MSHLSEVFRLSNKVKELETEIQKLRKENTIRSQKFVIRSVEERLHDGYYLIEHKGEPEILLWSTTDGWSFAGLLVGKKISEEMKVLAEVVVQKELDPHSGPSGEP